MIASYITLKRRAIFIITACITIYCLMLCYYVYQSQKSDPLVQNELSVSTKLLVVAIAENMQDLETTFKFAKQYQNPYILIGGFGDYLNLDDLKNFKSSIAQDSVFIGDISESAYKHAIKADAIAMINQIDSILVIAPKHFIPKARILFNINVSRETSMYFHPIKNSRFRLGYYHNYLHINFKYLLHKYFELVGFGKESSESFSGV